MSVIGIRRVRIKHGRSDMWYKHLAGFVFDVEPSSYGYLLAPTPFTKRSIQLAQTIDTKMSSSIYLSRVYLYDVEFVDAIYCQDNYPYLMVGQRIQLTNTLRIPKALQNKFVTIAGFTKGTERPFVYTENLRPTKRYKDFTIGIRRELYIEDMVLPLEGYYE